MNEWSQESYFVVPSHLVSDEMNNGEILNGIMKLELHNEDRV